MHSSEEVGERAASALNLVGRGVGHQPARLLVRSSFRRQDSERTQHSSECAVPRVLCPEPRPGRRVDGRRFNGRWPPEEAGETGPGLQALVSVGTA